MDLLCCVLPQLWNMYLPDAAFHYPHPARNESKHSCTKIHPQDLPRRIIASPKQAEKGPSSGRLSRTHFPKLVIVNIQKSVPLLEFNHLTFP